MWARISCAITYKQTEPKGRLPEMLAHMRRCGPECIMEFPCCSPLQESRTGSAFAGWRSWCKASRGLGSAAKMTLSRCMLPVLIPRAAPWDSRMEWRWSCATSPPRVSWYATPLLAAEAASCWQPSEAAAPSSAQTRTSRALTGFWSNRLVL